MPSNTYLYYKKNLVFRFLFTILWMTTGSLFADTIDHYVGIANNIPQMEMKADPQSQAWARSARNILFLTSESVAESLTLMNQTASAKGNAFFCLPPNTKLDGKMLNDLILQTYTEISSQQSDKEKMTVSEVALLGLSKQYPCQKSMQHQP